MLTNFAHPFFLPVPSFDPPPPSSFILWIRQKLVSPQGMVGWLVGELVGRGSGHIY